MESSGFLNPGFPITNNLMSSLKVPIQCFLLDLENLIDKSVVFTPLWNLDGPELPESAYSLDTPRYSNVYFFNSTCFIFFHQGVSLDSYIPEADSSFLSISKFDLYIGTGILIAQKWQNCFLFIHISKI